ncbi:MAG TPA: diaminopimelate epimerase [Ruminococcaceae bacterium]|nr:diaminopimelate epimerase [Oscillospiraceae bacterium]
MKFTKMHGAGNDYIYVNGFEEKIKDRSAFSVKVSDRHFGIGSDGLIVIDPSDKADFKMDMYNADGSQGKMCGNGIRCVAKFVYDNKMTDKDEVAIETLSGIKYIKLKIEGDKAVAATVNMGNPILKAEEIPTKFEGDTVVSQKLSIGENDYSVTCVSMGNPHCILYVDDVKTLNLEKIGPDFENHPMFPERINTEFIHIVSPTEMDMRVWERGSGETLACGTGACAAVVASVLNGCCERDKEIKVNLLGGTLFIKWTQSGEVYMTGPAQTVCTGEIDE